MRTGSHRAAALLAVLAALACVSERERLTAPIVELELHTDLVAPGDSVEGRVVATDRSGLILLVVEARSADSTSMVRRDRVSAATIELDFRLRVASTAVPGSVIQVIATAVDNQNFEVRVTDTAYVQDAP